MTIGEWPNKKNIESLNLTRNVNIFRRWLGKIFLLVLHIWNTKAPKIQCRICIFSVMCILIGSLTVWVMYISTPYIRHDQYWQTAYPKFAQKSVQKYFFFYFSYPRGSFCNNGGRNIVSLLWGRTSLVCPLNISKLYPKQRFGDYLIFTK